LNQIKYILTINYRTRLFPATRWHTFYSSYCYGSAYWHKQTRNFRAEQAFLQGFSPELVEKLGITSELVADKGFFHHAQNYQL